MSSPSAADDRRGESVLRHRDVALFAMARFAGEVSGGAQAVAIGWYLYNLTDSALALGFLGLARFIPTLSLVLVTGLVADRFNRRVILLICSTVELVSLVALAAIVIMGGVSPWVIYAIVALFGVARSFEHPTAGAFLTNVAGAREFPRAVAAVAAVRQYGSILGPVLGGLAYDLGPATVFLICGAVLLIPIASVSVVRLRVAQAKIGHIDLATLFAGFKFLRQRQVLLGAISLDMVAVLLGGATALMPIFARDILEAGPEALGALRAAPSVGAFVTTTFLAVRPIGRRAGRGMFIAVAIFGIATIVFGLSSNLWLSLAALAVLGAADGFSVVVRQMIIQLSTPDEMRGRVGAISSVFIATSNSLGDFESGLVASLIGAVATVVVGGLGTMTVVAVWVRLFPELWNAETVTGPR